MVGGSTFLAILSFRGLEEGKGLKKFITQLFASKYLGFVACQDSDARSECIKSDKEFHDKAVRSIEDALKQSNEANYCGRDDDFSRAFDRRFQ